MSQGVGAESIGAAIGRAPQPFGQQYSRSAVDPVIEWTRKARHASLSCAYGDCVKKGDYFWGRL